MKSKLERTGQMLPTDQYCPKCGGLMMFVLEDENLKVGHFELIGSKSCKHTWVKQVEA